MMNGLSPLNMLANPLQHHPDAAPALHSAIFPVGGTFSCLSTPVIQLDLPWERSHDSDPDGYEMLQGSDSNLVRAAGMTFGPYIGALGRHAQDIAFVRGMSMDTLTHEVGRRRFITGKAPSGLQARGSSAATWLASHYGGRAIPNLAIQVESYNRGPTTQQA